MEASFSTSSFVSPKHIISLSLNIRDFSGCDVSEYNKSEQAACSNSLY